MDEAVPQISDAAIDEAFTSIVDVVCSVTYKGENPIGSTSTDRHVFEIGMDEPIRKDLLNFKEFLDEDRGIWTGINDPNRDREDYFEKWKASIWCKEQDVMSLLPIPGEECRIQFLSVNIYHPSDPISRHTIVNIKCKVVE